MAPALHSNKNGRENTFFTERSHSEQSHLGLTGSCETGGIALSEVRTKCANSILVRLGTQTEDELKIQWAGLENADFWGRRLFSPFSTAAVILRRLFSAPVTIRYCQT